jgi:DNA-binding transcriptional LysR family regulator
MAEAAHAAALTASGQSQEIAGVVTITAAHLYATELLPPILAQIRKEAPALRIQVIVSLAMSDLMRREADIAIRHARPDQPDLTAKLVTEHDAALYATPELLAQGPLETLPFIGYDLADTYVVDAAPDGRQGPARERRRHGRGQPRPAGHGARGSRCRGAAALVRRSRPVLVRALPDAPPLVRFPVWLAAHRDLHTSRRIRLVFDRIAEGLAKSE